MGGAGERVWTSEVVIWRLAKGTVTICSIRKKRTTSEQQNPTRTKHTISNSAPTDVVAPRFFPLKAPPKVAQLLHVQQSVIRVQKTRGAAVIQQMGRRQRTLLPVERRRRATCVLAPSEKNNRATASAVVCSTLSHSTTDLREGRLAPYVDQSGCQSREGKKKKEKKKEELEQTTTSSSRRRRKKKRRGLWLKNTSHFSPPPLLSFPPSFCKKDAPPDKYSGFFFNLGYNTYTWSHTRART